MNAKRNGKWILRMAAIAALPSLWLARPAAAQYPAAGQDGHATDANNRVGSQGYNTPINGGPAVSGNQIVTHNVTGGKAFGGPLPYRDPGAFMGPTASGMSDAFIRGSSGVPTRFGAPGDLTQVHPFYGDSRSVAPPAGSLPEGFNGGYVGTSLTSPSSLSSSLNWAPVDTGLQARTFTRNELMRDAIANSSGYTNVLPSADQESLMLQSSPLASSPLMASPLFGIRPDDFSYNSTYFSGPLNRAPIGGTFPRESSVEAMRREMLEAAGVNQNALNGQVSNPNQTGNNQQQGENGIQPGSNAQQQQSTSALVQALNQPLEAPENGPLNNGAMGSSLNNNPLGSSVNTGQMMRQRLMIPAAALQSTQVSELDRRLQRYMAAHPLTDQQAFAQFQQQQRALKQQKTDQTPLVNNPTAPKPGNNAPGGVVNPKFNGNEGAGPLKIESLADGMRAKGLHDLMANAEELMRQEKFATAIERYNAAGRVAPNNPLIQLGRAIAELGAGYYAQAERDLRHVYQVSPATTFAQVDLSKMISADRLQYLRTDLGNVATANPTDERPWFLLAFMDFSRGDSAGAQKNLSEAEQRAGGNDPVVHVLQERWGQQPANQDQGAPGAGGDVRPGPRSGGGNAPAAQAPAAGAESHVVPQPATRPASELNK